MKEILFKTACTALVLGITSTSAYAACSCPSGYQVVAGVSVGRTDAKVCQKVYYQTIKRKASCDVGWSLDINGRGNKDLCASVWGTIGKYTIPQGTTGALGNPARHGWSLKIKSGRDYWEKSERKTSIRACAG